MDPKKIDVSSISAIAEMFSKNMGNMKPGEKPAWWQTYQYPKPPSYCSADQFINFTKIALFFQSLAYDAKVFDHEKSSDFVGTNEAVVATLEKNGCKLIYQSFDGHHGSRSGFFFLIENGALSVEITNLKRARIEYNCVTSSKETLEKVKGLMSGFSSEDKRNKLYMLSLTDHEPEFVQLGIFGVPVNAANYSPSVLTDYQYVVNQFNSDNPSGRLLLLNGLPGTGKTYIVRGLLNDLRTGTFVMAPPDMVGDLTKPQFVKSMLDASQNKFAKGPLYLIIEDADVALLRRGADNMGIISSLLNMADGLLGSALNLRIIATTNASKIDMEPAILRPGRLCKSILLDKLPNQQANELLNKLNPTSKKVFTSSTILADVYAAAAEVVE